MHLKATVGLQPDRKGSSRYLIRRGARGNYVEVNFHVTLFSCADIVSPDVPSRSYCRRDRPIYRKTPRYTSVALPANALCSRLLFWTTGTYYEYNYNVLEQKTLSLDTVHQTSRTPLDRCSQPPTSCTGGLFINSKPLPISVQDRAAYGSLIFFSSRDVAGAIICPSRRHDKVAEIHAVGHYTR